MGVAAALFKRYIRHEKSLSKTKGICKVFLNCSLCTGLLSRQQIEKRPKQTAPFPIRRLSLAYVKVSVPSDPTSKLPTARFTVAPDINDPMLSMDSTLIPI
jgi:hypothetical protein